MAPSSSESCKVRSIDGEAAGGMTGEGEGTGGGAKGAELLAAWTAFVEEVDKDTGSGADGSCESTTGSSGPGALVDALLEGALDVLALGCFGTGAGAGMPFLLKKPLNNLCSLLNSG